MLLKAATVAAVVFGAMASDKMHNEHDNAEKRLAVTTEAHKFKAENAANSIRTDIRYATDEEVKQAVNEKLLQFTTAHLSGGQNVEVSTPSSRETRFVKFSTQHQIHSDLQSGKRTAKPEASEIVSEQEVFSTHREVLGLDEKVSLQPKHTGIVKFGNSQVKRFDQVYHGHKVYAGDIVVTSSTTHNGVLSVHGLPFKTSQAKNYDLSKVNAAEAKGSVKRSVSKHLDSKKLGLPDFTQQGDVEVMWHMKEMASGRQGESSLVYVLHGNGQSTDFAKKFNFDAFVDVETHEVVDLMKKSGHFASPLGSKFVAYNYDLVHNDTSTDDVYYYENPARYSDNTIVFDNRFNSSLELRQFPTADDALNGIISHTLQVRNLMSSVFGGMPSWAGNDHLWSIEYNLDIANAYFDGDKIHLGDGLATDDVIAHEWAHGYTSTLNGLIYAGQPGALNEAFSDIVGETIDLLNNDLFEEVGRRSRSAPDCSPMNSGRWQMGEDSIFGSIRDMYWPTCNGQPDSLFSSYYYCGSSDGGGVHTNSGIANRMYAALADGAVFDIRDEANTHLVVRSLGLERAFTLTAISFSSLPPTAGYNDLAQAMLNMCGDGGGFTLNTLNIYAKGGLPGNLPVDSVHCFQVLKTMYGLGLLDNYDPCANRRLTEEQELPEPKYTI